MTRASVPLGPRALARGDVRGQPPPRRDGRVLGASGAAAGRRGPSPPSASGSPRAMNRPQRRLTHEVNVTPRLFGAP